MNANEIKAAARGFVAQMKDDARQKLNSFLRETGITARQLARDLGINEDELNRLQYGDGNLSLETFAILLIANGLVIEVKPISEAPIPTRNGVPVPPRGFEEPAPAPRGGFRGPDGQQLPPPPPGFFDAVRRGEIPAPGGAQPRDSRGRFMPRAARPEPAPAVNTQAPNFSTMSREKLVEIIQNKLWDSEIDVTRVPREQLVRFLEDKESRRAALQERRERESAEADPTVMELKDKIKKTLENNPHLRSFFKDLVG